MPHNATKELRPKSHDVGLPSRKAIAGPATLTTKTAPGAIKKSIAAEGALLRPRFSSEGSVPTGNYLPQKDVTTIEGHIKITSIIDVNKELLCCKYNEEYDYLAVGASDGTISLYQSETSDLVVILTDAELQQSTAPVTAIKHRPVSKNYPINNCFTCTYANGFVKCWNYNFRQCIYTIKENRETFGITYHPRYPKFVTYGDDLKIYLYDEESKTQERILTGSNNPKITDGPTSRVFAGCFNPRSNYELITAGWDDLVHFWDLRQPHSVRHISGVHMCGEGIDINAKGTEVLTCSFQKNNAFQIWDYGSGKLIATMAREDQNSQLYSGRFATKDYAVCGGTSPNVLQAVDLSSCIGVGAVMGLPSAVYSIDLGPAKKTKENVPSYRTDSSAIPSVAFVSGRKLYQISFY